MQLFDSTNIPRRSTSFTAECLAVRDNCVACCASNRTVSTPHTEHRVLTRCGSRRLSLVEHPLQGRMGRLSFVKHPLQGRVGRLSFVKELLQGHVEGLSTVKGLLRGRKGCLQIDKQFLQVCKGCWKVAKAEKNRNRVSFNNTSVNFYRKIKS